MNVSVHKSETSIKNYSTKTNENFLHMSVAIETVESTTEQLYIENNSVDMGR